MPGLSDEPSPEATRPPQAGRERAVARERYFRMAQSWDKTTWLRQHEADKAPGTWPPPSDRARLAGDARPGRDGGRPRSQ